MYACRCLPTNALITNTIFIFPVPFWLAHCEGTCQRYIARLHFHREWSPVHTHSHESLLKQDLKKERYYSPSSSLQLLKKKKSQPLHLWGLHLPPANTSTNHLALYCSCLPRTRRTLHFQWASSLWDGCRLECAFDSGHVHTYEPNNTINSTTSACCSYDAWTYINLTYNDPHTDPASA